MSKHAKYSPSSAFRWMLCKGSLNYLEYKVDSVFIKEGTEAHEILVNKKKYKECEDFTMILGANEYFGYIKKLIFGRRYRVLQEVRVSHGIYKEVYGTADCIIYNENELHVVDYKYGLKKVSIENNEQLMIYALCGIYTFKLKKIKKIMIHIVQPRIKYFGIQEIKMEDLKKLNKKLKEVLEKPKEEYNPGEKQCQYCPGALAGKCKAFLNNELEKFYKK